VARVAGQALDHGGAVVREEVVRDGDSLFRVFHARGPIIRQHAA
jgi:hypothetical protein